MNYAIGLYNETGMIQLLACEMDDENTWEECGDYFKSTLISDLTLRITDNTYKYSIKATSEIMFSLIDLRTESIIFDNIAIDSLYNVLKTSDYDEVTVNNHNITINMENYTLNINKKKLIAFGKDNHILEFVINTNK